MRDRMRVRAGRLVDLLRWLVPLVFVASVSTGTDWTTPKTWSHGEMITETLLNAIRDQLLHLKEQMTQTQANLSASKGFARELVLGTHPDADQATNKIQLRQLAQAVLDTGNGRADWGVLTADMTTTGAGGLDTGTEQASTWYQIYGIHNSATDAVALLLHRAKDFFKDEEYDSDDVTTPIRMTTNNRTAVGNGIKVDTTGHVPFVDVELIRVGAVTGNIWAELYADSGGFPTGSALATSDKMNAAVISTSSQWIRFVFRTTTSLTATTQYHLVMTGSWAQSDAVYIGWRLDQSSATYANGNRESLDGGTWNSTGSTTHDFTFKIYVTRNDTAVSLPGSYDGKVLLGYAYNDSGSDLDPFIIRDRMYVPLSTGDIGSPAGVGTVPVLVDMSAYVPPVQIEFAFWLRTGDNTSWDMRIGPVPGGYDAVNAGHRNAGVSRLDASIVGGNTLSLGQNMDPLITETQGLYVRAGAGTIDALIPSSWVW